ncbi:MAG TPA: glycosyltransferase family 1 protein [Gemmatimonadales bacterium]|nr:glycosyltransferase family 1 protein [Gemmatimonadales bacterium]
MRTGGAGTYAVGITRALVRRAVNEYVLFVPPAYRDFWGAQVPSGATLVTCGPHPKQRGLRVLFEQLRLPAYAARYGVGTIFFPLAVAPRWHRPRAVVTVLDVLLLSRATDFPWHKRLYLRWVYGRVARRADHVVTISQFCKGDIATRLKVPLERITVASPGVDAAFLNPPTAPAGLELPDRYVLSVAGAYPHKRLDVLLDAFNVIAREDPDLYLVMAGTHTGSKDAVAELRARAVAAEAGRRIVFLPPMEREALPAVFTRAAALVSASEFEGFGIPVLEAMAAGCPVAASPAQAVVEMLDGHGFVGRDFTVDALVDAIRAALGAGGDTVLQARQWARSRYTWDAAARALEAVFAS